MAGESALLVDPSGVPSSDDVGALGRALTARPQSRRDELMASLAAYSGLRWGELTALTAGQVDPAARVITVELGATKSLRSTLWRIRRAGADLVLARDDRLQLYPDVTVDVADLTDLAKQLIHLPDPGALARLPLLVECVELLPDWDDEWVVADRERYRLLRLEALECAASVLIGQRHFTDAIIAAQAAIQAEPLRESARRLVMRAQIAQGNAAEAIRSYREYRSLLREELGLRPSPLMDQLVQPFGLTGDSRKAAMNSGDWGNAL